MPITVKTTGRIVSVYVERQLGQAVREVYGPLGDSLVASLKSRAPEDRGNFKRSVKSRLAGRGLKTVLTVLADSDDAKWAEEGRGPGKQPPPPAMLALVRRKGLGARAFSIKTRRAVPAGTRRIRSRATGTLRTRSASLLVIQKSIAFLIGRKIGLVGTKGWHGFRDLKQDHAGEINAALGTLGPKIAALLNG